MNKKAVEVAPMNIVVGILLVLMVLLILVIIFGTQSSDFLNILQGHKDQLQENKCQSSIFGRSCNKDDTTNYDYEKLPPPEGGWDCDPCYKVTRKIDDVLDS